MRWRTRTLLAIVAVAALGSAGAVGLQRRGATFRRLAAYHEQAAAHLWMTEVGEVCTDGDADLEPLIRARGERAWSAHQAALYHERQAERCGRIARSPWLVLAVEPAPPLANPRFDFDPSQASDDPDGPGRFQ